MGIKAIIFDLDDTLYNGDHLTEIGLIQAVQGMIENGLNCSFEEALKKVKEIINENPTKKKFSELAKAYGCDENVARIGNEKYFNSDFDELEIYPDTHEVLKELTKKFKLVLLTSGVKKQQNKKIDYLKIRDYFDHVFIDENFDKGHYFRVIPRLLDVDVEEILVIGDRVDKEIETGKKLGMKTARLVKGKYKFLQPENEYQEPDHIVENLKEVLDVVKKSKEPKIVAIGGGTGLPAIAEGLRKYTDDLTLIVTVTDSGRSSGMLRKELDVLPPGDIRNNLIALSNSEKLMCDLFQYRFENGSLEGHSFGNLFIAALTKLTGDFGKAIEEAGKILKLKGKVLPSTFDNVHICAELEDGRIIEEENNIVDRHNSQIHKRPGIKRVFLKPNARANEHAIREILEADLIVICPGSLFTSVITNLLVDGISESIKNSRAKKVYICNIMTQVSQTHGLKASDHLLKISEHLEGSIDYVLLNNNKPDERLLESYQSENAFLVENNSERIRELFPKINIIEGDFLDDVSEKKLLWEKKDLLRHDPKKVGEIVRGLI